MRLRRTRAFVLAAVFFVMVVIVLLIASLFRLVPQEVRWSGDHKRETLAYYAASGGVKHALAWLRKVRGGTIGPSDPFTRNVASDPYALAAENNPARSPLRLSPQTDNGNPLDTYFPVGVPVLRSKPGRIRVGSDWSAEVHIFPDKNTSPHPFLSGSGGTMPPCYVLVSLAYRDVNGNGQCDPGAGENYALRVESSMVERTFARYAYFVDTWKDDGGNTPAFRVLPGMTEPLFAGPVHSNDTPVIEVLNANAFWGQAAGFISPFGDEISFSGDMGPSPKAPDSYDGLAYLGGNFRGTNEGFRPYLGNNPYNADPDRYDRLFKQGQTAIRRTGRLQLPNDWARLAAAAWGAQSGREVPADSAPRDQVFVNTRDLGIVSTGALSELRLDVVDDTGKSVAFDAGGRVKTTPAVGHAVVDLVQANSIVYISGTQDVYDDVVTTETGPYSYTQTNFSDTPQPGYSLQTYQASVGETTREVQQVVISGYDTITDPPGGAGPATGGTIQVPRYTTTTGTMTVPIFEERTRYVQEEVLTGDGPHPVTTRTVVGQEPVFETYYPNDAVVSAVDRDLSFASNYFLPGLVDPNDPNDPNLSQSFPVFTGATTGVQITVPRGKSLVVHQDRATGQTFEARLIDGKPNGVIGVFGPVSQLRGVNRGAKTIFAAAPDADREAPANLSDISINDHLLQYGVTPGNLPGNGDNVMGIIGANITLPADPAILALHSNAASALYIYASLFAAQGGFQAIQIPASPAMGELRVIGGVLQQQIGKLLVGSRGWSSRYRYDRFLTLNPPPTFPPDGRYDVTFFRVTGP